MIRNKYDKNMTLKAKKLCIRFKLFGRGKIPNLKYEQTHWSMDAKNSIFLKKKPFFNLTSNFISLT